MASRWQTVSKCDVTSGLVMLIDPQYVVPEHLWTRFLNKFRSSATDDVAEINGATVIHTHLGDGIYPVEARYNQNGQIVEVRIVFD